MSATPSSLTHAGAPGQQITQRRWVESASETRNGEEFVSVQQERSEQVGGAIPAQRTEATNPPAANPPTADPPAANPPAPPPGIDETVILPAFVTGKKEKEPKPAEPVRHQATPEGALPPSERGMLIFVAALLGVGTLAVVTVLGLGGFSSPPHPARTPSAAAAHPPVVTESPSPSPTPAASSPAPPPSPTPSPRRTTPSRVTLGVLTPTDPAAFCTYSKAGRARQVDGNWFCSGGSGHPPFQFAPGDVCQWRYLDKTAYAAVGDATDPATWTCYT
jgi:hypothetical protein